VKFLHMQPRSALARASALTAMALALLGLSAGGAAAHAHAAAPHANAAAHHNARAHADPRARAHTHARARAATAPPRSMTFVNRTAETIWVAATPGSTSGVTGWTLPAGSSVSVKVADHYNGRIWGRTGCHFNAQGQGHCQTGDCGGRFQCTGWGQIPATLAELNLDAWRHLDFYDVSMVDGSNLPMYINTVGGKTADKISADGCEQGHGCTNTVDCPAALQVKSGGSVVACISPCARFGSDRYCCRGQFAKGCSPARTWPIDYARVFKRAEPYAYSWSGDNATSVFTCTGDCGYRIVFGVTPPAVGGPPG
jgi:Thaumatin family